MNGGSIAFANLRLRRRLFVAVSQQEVEILNSLVAGKIVDDVNVGRTLERRPTAARDGLSTGTYLPTPGANTVHVWQVVDIAARDIRTRLRRRRPVDRGWKLLSNRPNERHRCRAGLGFAPPHGSRTERGTEVGGFQHLWIHDIDRIAGRVSDDLIEDV